MTTWSGSHPQSMPPPRDERSRSPSRGYGRPPYPDSGYPQDMHRPDWDAYNRERAWADYDRDRHVHDFGRRGRSRSPPVDDAGRKRRRSPSPYDRERFEPRPRYNDDYDTHSRAYEYPSPRGRGPYNYGGRPSRAPVDPHSLEYPASLKQYAEWFRYHYPQQATEEDAADKAAEHGAGDGSKPRNGIRTKWEKYKKDFLANQLQILFDHHRKSPWFSEKYDPSPEYVALRSRVRKVGWRGRINQFLTEVEDGKFDPNLDEVDQDLSLPVSPTTTKDKESSLAPDGVDAKGEEKKDDDDFGLTMEGDEEAADNGDMKLDSNGKTFSDGKRTLRVDEVSVLPDGNQIMIRTIPPDIGRLKLENVMKELQGFIYLALGDPMQKRNYYRAGWIKFADDCDIEKTVATLGEKKIEGFKLHVSHSTKPFANKVRQAPEVASKPDRIVKDLEQAKTLAALLEEEYKRVRQFKVEQAPPGDGNQDSEGAVKLDVDAPIVELTDDEPRERGSDAVERRIAKLVEDLPIPANESDRWKWENRKNIIALDLYLAYLRQAFNTCYYCASVSDHVEELQRKCIKHVRKPLSRLLAAEVAQQMEANVKGDKDAGSVKQESENDKDNQDKAKDPAGKDKSAEGRDWKRNDERWLDWLDSKVALLINREGVNVHDYGGKKYDDELAKIVEPFIKQEDEGKFRCKTCSKLFKATSFVEKHIANKHPEHIKPIDDLQFYNNFALDPQRIQPFTHPPPPVGNSQLPPPQAFGLQGPPSYSNDFGRGAPPPYYGAYAPPPQAYPPYPPPPGGWDPYGHPGYAAYPPAPPLGARSLRDELPLSSGGGRRLGDRIGGFAPGHEMSSNGLGLIHGIEGLPAKPPPAVEPGPVGRRSGRNGGGPPPPPPPDAKEDPRAAAGRRVSYHDMDLVAEGDVELTY